MPANSFTGNSAVATAPLPPLPDLSADRQGAGSSPDGSGLAQMLAGLMPVKQGVDQILAACQSIVRSGVVPNAEQTCAQIVALASSLVAQATQARMSMGGSMGADMGAGGGTNGGLTPGPAPSEPMPILGA